jgi:hypothetical protein
MDVLADLEPNEDNHKKIAIDRNENVLLLDTIQTPYNDYIQMVQ